jgi:hypothetical protein
MDAALRDDVWCEQVARTAGPEHAGPLQPFPALTCGGYFLSIFWKCSAHSPHGYSREKR